MEIRELKSRLVERSESVARYLLPNGNLQGRLWRCGDARNTKSKSGHGGSLHVTLSGDGAGLWHDDATGEGGDLIALWCISQERTLPDALKEIKQWLGITDPLKKERRQFAKPQKPKGLKKPTPKSAVFDYLTSKRGLSKDTLERFKIGEAVIGYDYRNGGKPEFTGVSIVFPYLDEDSNCLNISYIAIERPKGKKYARFAISGAEMCLFGWQAISPNSRTVIITEGQIDAMSWAEYGYEALSIPHGIGAMEWIENDWERLEHFETIYTSVDCEELSQKKVPQLFDRLGYHRCLNITLPFKDINKCLTEGVSQIEIDNCVKSAESIDPDEIRAPHIFLQDVLDVFHRSEKGETDGFGLSFEDRVIIRPAEFTLWCGEADHGKTTAVRQAVIDGLCEKWPVIYAGLEDTSKMALYKFTRQVAGEKYPKDETIIRVNAWLDMNLRLFVATGIHKAAKIIETFEYAFKRYGAKLAVLDNLTSLDIGWDDYAAQKEIALKLRDLALRTGMHVILVHHTKKGDYDSMMGEARDIEGAGSLHNLAHNTFMWKKIDREGAEVEQEQLGRRRRKIEPGDANALFKILKHKNTDRDEYRRIVKLYYHPEAYLFSPKQDDSTFRYINKIPQLIEIPESSQDYCRF